MTTTLLAHQFALNHQVAHANLQDVTHAESLVHPSPGGNCVNWVVGHVVATRNLLMDVLGEPHVWSDADADAYRRGAQLPLTAERALPLDAIVAAFDRSQETVLRRLPHAPDDQLTTLATLVFHESYHVGQCGLLRRLLGKAGAIA